jgi:Fic family protein
MDVAEKIEKLVSEYQSLNLSSIIDYDKFNEYGITHHSTTIEGSTLTEVETRLLLDEGLTPKGKPLVHSLMVQDHFKALQFVVANAKEKKTVTDSLMQEINAQVMKNTGATYNTIFGVIDSARGMYRKGNVSAGGSYFVGFDKVPALTEALSLKISGLMAGELSNLEKLTLSFDAHFDLVTIHPFYDGNGRTSRLLMNYIQAYYNLPLAIVFKEDKADYFQALMDTREKEDIEIFRQFMYLQLEKYLMDEIAKFKKEKNTNDKGGYSLIF